MVAAASFITELLRDALGYPGVGASTGITLGEGSDARHYPITHWASAPGAGDAGPGLPIVVALNMFPSDTAEEKKVIEDACREAGVPVAESTVFVDGGRGGLDLGRKVLEAIDKGADYKPLYDLDLSLKEKIETIAKNIYGAANVQYDSAAEKELKHIEEMGFRNVPVCIAKTPVSFSDDPAKLGAPTGFTLHVRDVRISAGAGFVVVLTGKVMTMPGLPKRPAAERIDVDDDGNITGLF